MDIWYNTFGLVIVESIIEIKFLNKDKRIYRIAKNEENTQLYWAML